MTPSIEPDGQVRVGRVMIVGTVGMGEGSRIPVRPHTVCLGQWVCLDTCRYTNNKVSRSLKCTYTQLCRI